MSFKETFSQEITRRKRQQSGLLAILFALGFVFLGGGIRFVLPDEYEATTGYQAISAQAFLYMGVMMTYEFLAWCTVPIRRRQLVWVPTFNGLGNAALEITILSVALWLISRNLGHPVLMLLSPLTYLYFIFITLSTLRLSVTLSIWTGLLAAVEFFALSLYLLETEPTQVLEVNFYLTRAFPYLIKASIVLLTGIGAAYVAHQIRRSIRHSIEHLETNEKMLTLFGQQVSPEVAQAIMEQHGALDPRHRNVAVLFLDIRNFTRYADTHPAEAVIAYQSTFLGIVARVVQQHGGIINQFMGDGCMITFGAPLIQENPAKQAVAAGMALLDAIRDANLASLIPATTVGIGIQTGDAVVGNIGTETRQQYNITGTVVIQAARIEQLNKEYGSQILVGQNVLDLLPAVPTGTKRMGAIHLKGIAEEVVVWQVA
ncbi:adenylate/guanylate cyclase domain-containing protein [Spirosoma arcticum]